MAWKPKYPPDPPKRAKRSFDLPMAVVMVLAIIVLAFGLDRVVRYVTGESRIASSEGARIITPSVAPAANTQVRSSITVVDGDTVSSGGVVYRLVGFDTPERGDRALCDKERDLAERASNRLHALVASGDPNLERVACACPAGTEGKQSCNFGRACASLRVSGRDVGEALIREGLAQPFVCGATSCPPRRRWC